MYSNPAVSLRVARLRDNLSFLEPLPPEKLGARVHFQTGLFILAAIIAGWLVVEIAPNPLAFQKEAIQSLRAFPIPTPW